MPKVDTTRSEYDALTESWALIRDCVTGSRRVKAKGDKYLPRPNPTDMSSENIARYEQYKDRAVFYNVTARTVAGLSGQVFKKSGLVELPEEIAALEADVDGGGVSLGQQSKKVLTDVLEVSRVGLFVDYPDTGGAAATREQLESGLIRPSILHYTCEAIINWRLRKLGGVNKLAMVTLEEIVMDEVDQFEEEAVTQWRVLTLDSENLYQVDVWRKNEATGEFEVVESFQPADASGKRLDYIPFFFVGSVNNDPSPDAPLMYDMAELNISHYRNSADYEEAVFITGQPTPYFSGLTEDWVERVWKGKVQLGSRAAVALPQNGSGGLLQVAPNTLPSEAMRHKEEQMIAIGAKLIEQSTIERTATEVVIKDFGEHANLTTVSKNVSEAYRDALEAAQAFVTTSGGEIVFQLNMDFEISSLDANEQAVLVALWQAGAIVTTEMRERLRKGGVATLQDDDYKARLETEGPPEWAGPAGASFDHQGGIKAGEGEE